MFYFQFFIFQLFLLIITNTASNSFEVKSCEQERDSLEQEKRLLREELSSCRTQVEQLVAQVKQFRTFYFLSGSTFLSVGFLKLIGTNKPGSFQDGKRKWKNEEWGKDCSSGKS